MTIEWEWINGKCTQGFENCYSIYRSAVPGGWLVRPGTDGAACAPGNPVFVPDPDHVWGREAEILKAMEEALDTHLGLG